MVTDMSGSENYLHQKCQVQNYQNKDRLSVCSGAAFLKVGGIAPLGAILNGKGAKTPKEATGGRNNIKRAKMLNH